MFMTSSKSYKAHASSKALHVCTVKTCKEAGLSRLW